MTILAVYVLFITSSFCSGEFLNLGEILSRFIFTSKREKEETKKNVYLLHECFSLPNQNKLPKIKAVKLCPS